MNIIFCQTRNTLITKRISLIWNKTFLPIFISFIVFYLYGNILTNVILLVWCCFMGPNHGAERIICLFNRISLYCSFWVKMESHTDFRNGECNDIVYVHDIWYLIFGQMYHWENHAAYATKWFQILFLSQ